MHKHAGVAGKMLKRYVTQLAAPRWALQPISCLRLRATPGAWRRSPCARSRAASRGWSGKWLVRGWLLRIGSSDAPFYGIALTPLGCPHINEKPAPAKLAYTGKGVRSRSPCGKEQIQSPAARQALQTNNVPRRAFRFVRSLLCEADLGAYSGWFIIVAVSLPIYFSQNLRTASR